MTHTHPRQLLGRSNGDAAPGLSRHGKRPRRPQQARRSHLHEMDLHVFPRWKALLEATSLASSSGRFFSDK